MNEFKFSQTSLKDFEKEDGCPAKWKGLYVDQLWKREPTKAMLKGSYFEQLWLGMGARDDKVLDLERLKNGKKSTDQIRIEEQAQRAKDLFDPFHKDFLGFTINKIQFPLSFEDREGTADIWAVDSKGESWLIDAKLTEDLTSKWGDYGWGKPYDELDLIQLPHYQDLFFGMFGHRPRMALFIADYSPKKRIEFNEITITDEKRMNKEYRFKQARKLYEEYSATEFPFNPSIKECKSCKLDCKFRINEA